MTAPTGRPAVTPFDPGDRVTFDNDPTAEVLVVVSSGPYSTTVSTPDGGEVSHGTYLLSPAPAPAPAYACVQHITRGPECGPECDRLTARYRAPAPARPRRRAAYPPGQVIREMTEVSRMDHPWIPGARAVLIRDAAALLESQEDTLARIRARVVDLAFQYDGSPGARPFADDLRALLDLIPPPAL